MDIEHYVGIAVVVIPVAVALFRYIWKLGSVQDRVKKLDYAEMIDRAVDTAINAVEQWSKENTDLKGPAKKAKAMELAKTTATKFGVPAYLLDNDMVEGYIEAALRHVDW